MNFNKVKTLLASNILRNGAWLYVLQIFNTVIPILTLPYITRVLGSGQFGVFAFSLNIIGYLQVIVEYGFNLSGSRKIAIAKDKNEVERIYSTITTSKVFLCVLNFSALLVISQILSIGKSQLITLLILYFIVIGVSLQQTWLFQGLQRMKYITIFNVVARTLSFVLIFTFVNTPNDIYIYSLLYAITYIMSGIISIIFISIKLNIKYRIPSFKSIMLELKDGWYTFTTSAMTKIFSGFGITVLGITTSDNNVGVYSAIQKLPIFMSMMYAPIGQAIFPYISSCYLNSYKEGINKVKKVSFIVMPIVLVISLFLMFNSSFVIGLLFGEEFAVYSKMLFPLIIWMVFSILNNFLGVQILVASGHLKKYSSAFRVGVIALLTVNVLFGTIWGMYGIAFAAMIAEFILTLALIYQVKKVKFL